MSGLLLRYDHSPGRDEQNISIGETMQFRLYHPDTAYEIDITKFKVRFNGGIWYEHGHSSLTFTEISSREYRVYFNPPDFDYDTQISVELYCGGTSDHGILLEIL